MKFTLTIKLGNEAMQTTNDLGRIVSSVGHKLVTQYDGIDLTGGVAIKLKHHVRDDNGNTVGSWDIDD